MIKQILVYERHFYRTPSLAQLRLSVEMFLFRCIFIKCLDLTTLFLRLRRNIQCSVHCVLEFHKFVSICYHTDKVPIRYHKIVANYSIFIHFSLQPLNLTSHVFDKDCSSEAQNNNQYRKEILCRFCRSSKLAELRSCKFKKISGGSRGGALGAYAPPFKNSKKMIF